MQEVPFDLTTCICFLYFSSRFSSDDNDDDDDDDDDNDDLFQMNIIKKPYQPSSLLQIVCETGEMGIGKAECERIVAKKILPSHNDKPLEACDLVQNDTLCQTQSPSCYAAVVVSACPPNIVSSLKVFLMLSKQFRYSFWLTHVRFTVSCCAIDCTRKTSIISLHKKQLGDASRVFLDARRCYAADTRKTKKSEKLEDEPTKVTKVRKSPKPNGAIKKSSTSIKLSKKSSQDMINLQTNLTNAEEEASKNMLNLDSSHVDPKEIITYSESNGKDSDQVQSPNNFNLNNSCNDNSRDNEPSVLEIQGTLIVKDFGTDSTEHISGESIFQGSRIKEILSEESTETENKRIDDISPEMEVIEEIQSNIPNESSLKENEICTNVTTINEEDSNTMELPTKSEPDTLPNISAQDLVSENLFQKISGLEKKLQEYEKRFSVIEEELIAHMDLFKDLRGGFTKTIENLPIKNSIKKLVESRQLNVGEVSRFYVQREIRNELRLTMSPSSELSNLAKFISEIDSEKTNARKLEILKERTEVVQLLRQLNTSKFHLTSDTLKAFIAQSPSDKLAINLSKAKSYTSLSELLNDLAKRNITGHKARYAFQLFLQNHLPEPWQKDLMYKILDRKLNIKILAKSLNNAFDQVIPTFKVSLAHELSECKFGTLFDKPRKSNHEWLISQKFDGVRCLALIGPSLQTIQIVSRTGRVFDSLDLLKDIIREYFGGQSFLHDPEWQDGLVLDGELCVMKEDENNLERENFRAAIAVSKRSSQMQDFKYNVFDCLTKQEFKDGSGNRNLRERITFLNERLTNTPVDESRKRMISVVKQSPVQTEQELQEWWNKAKSEGWEGLILRKNIGYDGKRSSNFLKIKQRKEKEFTIIDMETGIMKINDKEETVLANVYVDFDGNRVSVGSGFDWEERVKYKERGSIIGKKITVEYTNVSFTSGEEGNDDIKSLRHPRMKKIWEGERDL
ncbi:hypothetical protein G9A89_005911 [Geosiphon pyriformis]|nr:hypothetical protein G9A89_005911 [Geosiphon pyriformis]